LPHCPPPPRRRAQGASTPEDCVGQFVTSPGLASFLPYDMIATVTNGNSFSDTGLTSIFGDDSTTLEQCQDGCKVISPCQYFTYFNYTTSVPAVGSGKCFLRNAYGMLKTYTAASRISVTDPANLYTLLEAKTGMYAVYPAASPYVAIGTTIATGQTWAAAKAACDANPACIGMQNTATGAANVWRTFAGAKWQEATTKIRFEGEALNAWVASPTFPMA
jgi:hypothetical protein